MGILIVDDSEDNRTLLAALLGAKPIRKLELLPRVMSALSLKREMDARKLAYTKLEANNKELQAALAEVKVLRKQMRSGMCRSRTRIGDSCLS